MQHDSCQMRRHLGYGHRRPHIRHDSLTGWLKKVKLSCSLADLKGAKGFKPQNKAWIRHWWSLLFSVFCHSLLNMGLLRRNPNIHNHLPLHSTTTSSLTRSSAQQTAALVPLFVVKLAHLSIYIGNKDWGKFCVIASEIMQACEMSWEPRTGVAPGPYVSWICVRYRVIKTSNLNYVSELA